MLLEPKKTKFRKLKKKFLYTLLETRSCQLNYGFIGLKAMDLLQQ
jgi:hypothetical protein